jgi:hypothetical protein
MTTHDTAYKQLFSHPRMVEDLLRGYVTEEWVSEIDFSTLERVADSFIHELQEIHSMLADRIDSWFQQWERQGMQKGMQKGESRLLLQLIQHRFGHDLPGWVESRLAAASSEQLEGWGMTLLTANTLAEVFGDPPE